MPNAIIKEDLQLFLDLSNGRDFTLFASTCVEVTKLVMQHRPCSIDLPSTHVDVYNTFRRRSSPTVHMHNSTMCCGAAVAAVAATQ